MKNIEDVYVASPMQQGLIFHSLYSPEAADYVVQHVSEFEGDLDSSIFRDVWQHMIDRYHILRTFFIWEDTDEVLQVVCRKVELPFEEFDWRDLPEDEQQARFQVLLKDDRARSFDLTEVPLMRLTLIRLADRVSTSIWTHHHALLDGWSAFQLFRESFDLYEAKAAKVDLILGPSTPYREYIAWLQQQDMTAAEKFWREKLSGYSNSTPLTGDRRLWLSRNGNGNSHSAQERQWPRIYLSEDLTAALRRFARQRQITLNTVLMGAWSIVLSTYGGTDDIAFGTVVSGRPATLPGVETMVGPFINLLPMRVKVDRGDSLTSWLQALQAEHLAIRAYDYSPLVQMHAWSEVPKGTPLFETMMVFENYPVDDASLERAVVLRITKSRSFAKTNYPLSFEVTPLLNNLLLQISYDPAYFAGENVERLLAHIVQLLEGFVARPEARVGDRSLVTKAEQQQILLDWNDTALTYEPAVQCGHELFERQVQETPQAEAVVFGEDRLSYEALNRRANQLAHYLRRLGVGAESRVGLYVERSLEMVVGLLGVLKAGAAYVPLDPGYPRARLSYMVEDAAVAVLLTQAHLQESVPGATATTIYLDRQWEEIARESEEELESGVTAENLAYIIYTSGSTGQPKGIAMPHGPLVNLIQWQHDRLGFSRKAKTLQFASLSFDVSFGEIFATWACGGVLVLIPELLRRDIPALARFIKDEQIERLFLPFVALQQLAEEFLSADPLPEQLQTVISAGEQLQSTTPIKDLFSRLENCTLHNQYGPSESHVVTVYTLTGEISSWPALPPIGRPIANSHHYILNADLQALPVNVAGELYIGGDALARGYLNKPGLTADKFIPNPYGRMGERLYRTGDLARYLPDGNIEYLGRIDYQVKMRGFRIEPGEIETVLSRHPKVKEAVVVARQDSSGNQRLIAYVVGSPGEPSLNSSELRDYLGQSVPDYMVPSSFMTLESLPLTPSGKIARNALPLPEMTRGELTTYVPPRTPVEEIMANIWSVVLGVPQVGINDDFFELGGHSLLATQVISRAQRAFSVEVSLRSLFETRTLGRFSQAIEKALSSAAGLDAPPVQPRAGNESLPLSFAQQRLWFIDQLEPGGSSYNLPFAVGLNGDFNVAALEQVFQEIVRRHESLRTTFSISNDGPIQIIREAGHFVFAVEDLSGLAEEMRQAEAQRIANEETSRAFDLTADMPIRVKLLKLSEVEHVLVVTMHHIVSDGWSFGVLLNEMTMLYEAFVKGEPATLEELPVQYADFALWQREWLQGERMDLQLSYWKEQLQDVPVLDLPFDKPRPSIQAHVGDFHTFSLPGELRKSLEQLSRNSGASLFMVLLAAFKILLFRYCHQSQIVVGSPIANRNRSEIEGLIGFFVNTLVLKSELSGTLSFAQVLRQVREVCLGAYAHQDVPFEKLVEELQPERNMSHSPLFQVMFILQNTPVADLQMSGLELSRVKLEHASAKYDLTLSINETDEGLRALLNYDTSLFEKESIERMAVHFEQLLRSILENTDEKIGNLKLLSDAERQQILFDWNATWEAYEAAECCVHELFARQAEKTPQAEAVVFEEERLTYEELNRRANQLAHYLRRLGVGAESRVGLYVERSLEMVVGLLGVLKAGACYVPLDPGYPRARLSYMVEDASVAVLLTQAHLQESVPGVAPVICLDEQWAEIAGESEQELESGATAENLAYIIYTSGSTGQPKGVMITHHGLVNYLNWAAKAYQVDQGNGSLVHSPLAFDLTVTTLWAPLVEGQRVELIPENEGVERLSLALSEGNDYSLVKVTPSHLQALADLLPPDRAQNATRALIIGGDALRAENVDFWRDFAPRTRLINEYGPTETVVGCCVYSLQVDDPRTGPVPIGRPVGNTQLYVLDEYFQPVPCGVSGELYIGGSGVARGYVNQPGLTAERFVPDPFSNERGARLYRTGDLARYLGNGQLEYLGRMDQQVKLRGFRIELGEIEAALQQQEAVREAVVGLREVGGEPQLVAYVVWADVPGSVSELRESLSERLPGYMVPGRYVELAELPLTSNGKVDRRALAELAIGSERRREGEYVAPRTATEAALEEVWREVLVVERAGVHDNFFTLGGHSLLATKLIARVRKLFQVELPLRVLFEGPTIAALAGQVEQALSRAGSGAAGVSLPAIARVSRETALPLSFSQQRLWFLEQLEPGSFAYNIPAAIHLAGELNIAVLEQSLNAIIGRHEALRTVFQLVDGQAVQVIRTPAEQALQLTVARVAGVSAEERQATVQQLAQQEAQTPFDLAAGPLLRASLLELEPAEHVLLLTLHHIIADGWSLNLFFAELRQHYAAGGRAELEELPIQYGDYAAWQREWLGSERMQEQLAYWKQQLGSAPAVLELPADRPRPVLRSYRGATESFVLRAGLAEALTQLSVSEGVTLFMTLLAAFQTLLHRYSGQERIVVGTPVANRSRSELEPLIGCFINVLALHSDASQNPRFQEFLGHVREVCLGAYTHEELPFELLVDELQPERNLSHTPLFQVMFSVQSGAGAMLELPGITLTPLAVSGASAKFDLMLGLRHSGAELMGVVEYSTDLFDAATIKRMVGHFEVLLAGIVADPQQRLGDLPLLTETEATQLQTQWNATAVAYETAERCVHELFARQAEETPQAEAVVFGAERLSYEELNRRANQLAHYLRRQGVGAESRVGLYVERSLEMVVGLLGVLKAGACYVPLDPGYPRARSSYMVEDAAVAVLLTQAHLKESVPGAAPVICLDEQWAEIARESEQELESGATAENLAYIIYTSGSTGQPKGAMITHRALVNHMLWMGERFPLSSSDRVLQKTPFSFDASVWEFFAPLLAGSPLILAEQGAHQDSHHLLEAIKQHEVTVLQVVPTLLRMLIEADGLEECRSLRRLFCGGEALPVELLDQVRERLPQVEMCNLYGPTETAIEVSYWSYSRGESKIAPIGTPISNAQLYVLDQRMKLAPVGVAGELYVGGSGVGRGYWGRPDLTASKFLPDPFSSESGARLYRTGDLARYLGDGQLEYLGRMDQQVKLRGFRIELGEIEAALQQQEAVREAVVGLREVGGEPQLVAYVVWTDVPGAASEIRESLSEHLAGYMVPGRYVELAELPLTSNGKVDRRALAELALGSVAREGEYVAPRTATEAALEEVWREVLVVERAGVHDNFFALGGHSLLATKLIARVRKLFQVELPLRVLFEGPTIAALAGQVEQAVSGATGVSLPAITPVSRETALPLSFSQQRLWFLEQLEPGSFAYNIPAAIHLAGELNVAVLEQSLNAIVGRHEALRTVFQLVDGQAVQVIRTPAEQALQLTVTRVAGVSAEERQATVQQLAQQEAQTPFDLAAGPLLRASLLELGVAEHVLLLTLHHIIADGWSLNLFFAELRQHYAAGSRAELEELPIQYGDYAAWQREWLGSERMQEQLGYWKQQLGSAPAVLELPADRPRPVLRSYRGATESFVLRAGLAEALTQLSVSEGVTLFMTLLAAFQTLLHRYSGQERIVVGTPVANRSRSELEPLIGCFINVLALHSDASQHPRFREFLGHVREVCLGAYTHEELPFELLVDELQPERNLSHTPLFQVMFSVQSGAGAVLELPGITLTPLAVSGASAKFDLMLGLRHSGAELMGVVEYSTDLFDAATIKRMVGHFEVLLEGIVADPQQRLGDLPLLTTTEATQLQTQWNATAVAYETAERCVHELFARQAEETPQAEAVVFGAERLSYEELNGRANQLAHYLRRLGVGAESRVGLYVERSLEMVVGLLGVLKAGACYVPLDPSYPRARLSYMVEDAAVAVLLTQAHLQESVPGAAPVICLDEQWAEIAGESEQELESGVTAENLAYIIYTSGSTGQPKGVAIEHRSLSNLLRSIRQEPGLTANDRLLSVSTLSFDIATLEILLPLRIGASITIASRDETTDGFKLLSLLRSSSVTVMQATPATWRMLLASGWDGPEPRKVLCGGEALSIELAQQLNERSREVWNLYGPTETTIYSSLEEVGNQRDRQTIGHAIANTQLYVLDHKLRLVPLGVAGELHVGGVGLARGYVNQPAQTAERFVPDPFSTEPGARLYRTGDLVRCLGNRQLEYLGRMDQQVKVRGFRIELGEIEAALQQQEAVREAVVGLREAGGEQQLVAYVVWADGVPGSPNELRESLSKRLPGYMAPGRYVELAALPLTSNGKVDRRALAALAVGGGRREVEYVAPRTATEAALEEVWREVLAVDHAGVHDNFFTLGGDSILTIQIVIRAKKRGLTLTPKNIFQHPTIASLAEVADRSASPQTLPAEIHQPGETLLKEAEVLETYPLSPMQEVILAESLSSPTSGVYVPQLVFRVGGDLDREIFEQVWDQLIERYSIFRTSFVWKGIDGPLQVVAKTAKRPVTYYDWRGYSSDEQQVKLRALIDENLKEGFDLKQAPLARFTLIQCTDSSYRIVWSCHHILMDGWSNSLVLAELFKRYETLASGNELQLPPVRPYRDFIGWLSHQETTGAEDYWRRTLKGFTAPTRLASNRAGLNDSERAYGEVRLIVAKDIAAKLINSAREHGLTLNTLIQGAWVLLLSRYRAQDEVMFGTVVSGRPYDLDRVENMVGLFINTLPVRVKLPRDGHLLAWLKELQSQQVDMRSYEQTSLSDIQRWSDLPADAQLFDTIIRFQNFPIDPSLRIDDEQSLTDETLSVDWWHYPLCLVVEMGPGLSLFASYARSRFDNAAVKTMLEQLQDLLEYMAANLSQEFPQQSAAAG